MASKVDNASLLTRFEFEPAPRHTDRRIHVGGDVFFQNRPFQARNSSPWWTSVVRSVCSCLSFTWMRADTLGIVASDVDPGLLVGGIDGRRSFLDLVGGCRRNRSRLGYERGHIGND